MRVPSYLRQKKAIPFFEARSKKDRHRPLLHFAVGVLNDEGVRAEWTSIMGMNPGASDEWMGVRRRLIRRGKASYLGDGLELLGASHNTVTGDVHYNYNILFLVGSRRISATFFGQGDLSVFEALCRQIVSSIRLAKGGDERQPAGRDSKVAGGLGRADRRRLKEALSGLPPEIAYLRRPILALAKEDQDLLGSGEGDIRSIERALRRNSKPGSIKIIAKYDAELLHGWLVSLPGHDGAWAAPAWFVEGVLRGSAIWS